MAVLNIGTLTDIEKTSFVREGLDIAKPNLIYQQYGMGDRVEKREGKTRQWFRMTKPTVLGGTSTTFAAGQTYFKGTTGAPPTFTPATPADTAITASVDCLYGQGHEWNEAVEYTSFSDIPKELRILNAQHAAESIETEVITVLVAGTTVGFANGKASRNLLTGVDQIDMADVFTQVTTLRNNDAKPIKGDYSVLCSANTIKQLMSDTAFQSAIQFQKPYIFAGTIAELYGCRFAWSSLAPTVANSGSNNAVATVEQSLFIGSNSYGITKWMLNDYELVYTGPGGWNDEWAVRHALTWKYYFKSVILNQSWMLRFESAR